MLTRPALAAIVVVALLAGCTTPASGPAPTPAATVPATDAAGPAFPYVGAGASGISVQDGDDWSLPGAVRPAANSGFFSEQASSADHIFTRSIDVSWRQIRPTKAGGIDWDATGAAQGLTFASLRDQLADPSAFWMRVFASGTDWAPEWVARDCSVRGYGPDYDGQSHLPIWNECVWGHLMDTYRMLFADAGLASDARLTMLYVPGAFTWAEFDYEMISAAVDAGDLDFPTYSRWYAHAWTDLATLFGPHARKLVFTGEDYPFGPFGADENLLAQDAVSAGLGIRTGITEVSNFHLSEAPAYGSRVAPDGHLLLDDTLPIHDGTRIVATENECYTDCGYATDDPYYAVRQSNLKALQLRVNWLYIVPGPSYVGQYPEHWDWVRMSLGQTAATSPDAWADLRDAEDTYWQDQTPPGLAAGQWANRPYVRNLERWLVQEDTPGSVAHRTSVDSHDQVLGAENGRALEGLSTAVAAGDTGFDFAVDPRFAASGSAYELKVTFLDQGTGGFRVDAAGASSPIVDRTGSGAWRTATIAVPGGALDRIRVSLVDGSSDLVVRFARLVKVR